MQAHALVDFHNLPHSLKGGSVESLARAIDGLVTSQYPAVDDVNIRLYGGWFDDHGLSRDGTRLSQEVGKAFPLTLIGLGGRMRYVRCEIASSLVDSRADIFPATVRHRHGLERYLRDPHPSGCVDQPNCTVSVVMRWSRKGCPTSGCPVKSFDAFRCMQQKLVDTLICCDLLSLGVPDPGTSVFLISDDDDFVPALVMAGLKGAAVWHVRAQPNKVQLYDQLLIQRGVRLIAF